MHVIRSWRDGKLIEYTVNGIPKSLEQMHDNPTLFQKMSNATEAVTRVIKAKYVGQKATVPDEERDRRMSICTVCEFFTGVTCLKCGCVARWKTKLATEKCPVDKW